jgi:hypothetical protein
VTSEFAAAEGLPVSFKTDWKSFGDLGKLAIREAAAKRREAIWVTASGRLWP